MKKILPIVLTLAIAGCGGGNSGGNPGGGNPGGGNPGGTTYNGVVFTMIAVPSKGYEIAQTELTN